MEATRGLGFRVNIGIMEKKMEATRGLGLI